MQTTPYENNSSTQKEEDDKIEGQAQETLEDLVKKHLGEKSEDILKLFAEEMQRTRLHEGKTVKAIMNNKHFQRFICCFGLSSGACIAGAAMTGIVASVITTHGIIVPPLVGIISSAVGAVGVTGGAIATIAGFRHSILNVLKRDFKMDPEDAEKLSNFLAEALAKKRDFSADQVDAATMRKALTSSGMKIEDLSNEEIKEQYEATKVMEKLSALLKQYSKDPNKPMKDAKLLAFFEKVAKEHSDPAYAPPNANIEVGENAPLVAKVVVAETTL